MFCSRSVGALPLLQLPELQPFLHCYDAASKRGHRHDGTLLSIIL